MAKAKQPKQPVLSLEDIQDYKPAATANLIAERHHSRSRAYLEMGKLIYHLENRAGMRREQTVYGLLKSRGVPEGSINNGRLAASFIATFVVAGLLVEATADDILTSRIARQSDRLQNGKGKAGLKMPAEDIAAILSTGSPAEVGDELDCLAEHGKTIADKAEADKTAAEDLARIEAAAKAAADSATETPAEETAPAETPAAEAEDAPPEDAPEEEEGEDAPEEEAPEEEAPEEEEAADDAPEAEITPIEEVTKTKAPAPPAAPEGSTTADVLEMLQEAQLASFDLDPDGVAAVDAYLADWRAVIEATQEALKAA